MLSVLWSYKILLLVSMLPIENYMHFRHLWFRLASETSAINWLLRSHKSSYNAHTVVLPLITLSALCSIYGIWEHVLSANPLSGKQLWAYRRSLQRNSHRWNLLNLCNERIRLWNRQERPKFLLETNHRPSSNSRKRKPLLAPCATVSCYCSLLVFGQDVPLRSRAKYTRIKAFIKPKGSLLWD